MIPTLDPPPAAPLTAEQIAAIVEQAERDVRSLSQYGPNALNIGKLIQNDGLYRIIASHTALRDRLVRAEAWIVVLEGVMRSIEHIDIGGWTEWGQALPICPACLVQYEEPHELDCPLATALATPTDGAERAGGAAGDEEATDGQS